MIDYNVGVKIQIHKRANESRKFYKELYKVNQALYKKYGDTLIWHKAYYQDNDTPLKVCCKSHGFFKASVNQLLNKKYTGCPKCAKNRLKRTIPLLYKGIKYTNKLVVEHLKEHHPSITIVGKFKGFNNPLSLRCAQHGIFNLKNPRVALKENTTICKACAGSKNRTSNEEFIEKCSKLHNNRYTYEKTNYQGARSKIVVTCRMHGDFTINRASDHIYSGTGCPSCFKGGFRSSIPGTLYYLSINDGQAYKIGITNNSVHKRYMTKDHPKFKIIKTWYYENGEECRSQEQKILQDYKYAKYKGPSLLVSCGISEMFSYDILDLDTA